MKTAFKLLLLFFCLNKTILAQEIYPSAKPSKETLLNYCGTYLPANTDKQLVPMCIIIEGENIYRRLNGDMDRLLIAVSDKKFVYADGSGRDVEFTLDNNGKVLNVILSRPDGVFTLKRINAF